MMSNYMEAIVINMHIPSFIITKQNEALQKTWKRLKNKGKLHFIRIYTKKECCQLNDYPKL